MHPKYFWIMFLASAVFVLLELVLGNLTVAYFGGVVLLVVGFVYAVCMYGVAKAKKEEHEEELRVLELSKPVPEAPKEEPQPRPARTVDLLVDIDRMYQEAKDRELLTAKTILLKLFEYVRVCEDSTAQDDPFVRSLFKRAEEDDQIFGQERDYMVKAKKIIFGS